ncbi:uncharacterized protein METZ01_LOCUS129590, partial [marine metagenome]
MKYYSTKELNDFLSYVKQEMHYIAI